jgi:multicomponent Na+:H+ antiporter subunit G
MTDALFLYAAAFLMLLGAAFAFVGALGLLRFPDLYARSHAASKAGTVGSSLAMLAIAVAADDLSVSLRALAGIGFLLYPPIFS